MIIDLIHPNRTRLLEKWKDVVAFDKISPWTTCCELAWLAEASSRGVYVGEVGSYKGKSAKAMALGKSRATPRTPGTKIVCCDRFQDNTEADFEQNLKEEIANGIIEVIAMESQAGANLVTEWQELHGWKFDMFFIDASHEKHDVLRDIQLWAPLVRPGGILAFHDCYPGEVDNGISQALEEVYPDYHLVIDSIAAVRIPPPALR